MGQYCEYQYKRQRICDVMVSSLRSYAWFLYLGNKPTGDHFVTLKALKAWVDDKRHAESQ